MIAPRLVLARLPNTEGSLPIAASTRIPPTQRQHTAPRTMTTSLIISLSKSSPFPLLCTAPWRSFSESSPLAPLGSTMLLDLGKIYRWVANHRVIDFAHGNRGGQVKRADVDWSSC
jgi:hypothetical protein